MFFRFKKLILACWPASLLLLLVGFFGGGCVLKTEAKETVAAKVFTVSPTKLEIKLGPGEDTVRNIYLTNKSGRDLRFRADVEDISNGQNESEIVRFYGSELGPYSIKNYTLVDSNEFTIKNGETRAVPVMFTLPYNYQAGRGLYGAVFFSTISEGGSAARIFTRVGSLIFIKTKQEVVERGSLKKFGLLGRKNIYSNKPARFQVVYENTGDVYLNPYGYLEIENKFTHQKVFSNIKPYFVFPNSTRLKEIVWASDARFGYFTARLYLNRGYGDQIDQASFNFWVIPFDLILSVIIALAILIFLYKAVLKFKHKQWEESPL